MIVLSIHIHLPHIFRKWYAQNVFLSSVNPWLFLYAIQLYSIFYLSVISQ